MDAADKELETCGKTLFEQFRKEFELQFEEIEEQNLKQGYDKTPKRPIDICDRCHEVVHAIVPWRVNRSGYLQWVCLRCDRELREGKR